MGFGPLPPDVVPSASFDAHFGNVPGLVEVSFNTQQCAELFVYPRIGMWPQDLRRTHILVRPDYELGYSHEEQLAIRAANPKDYDTEAASSVLLEENGPYGRKGDVLITIVYGAGYGVNKLLCHQGVMARDLHAERRWRLPRIVGEAAFNIIPGATAFVQELRDTAEKRSANAAMKDPLLKSLRRGIIRIDRQK
jgi:hypothetical protein